MSRKDEIEAQLSEAAAEAHDWKRLMEFGPFERLTAFLRQQQSMRAVVCMMSPITNEHTAFAQEMLKGEYRGIELALTIAKTQHEQAENLVKQLSQELDNELEIETRIQADESRIGGDPFVDG